MRLCRPALYSIVLARLLLLYCFSKGVILRSCSNRGCQWRFDWQNHHQDLANGCRVQHLVVMRMGLQRSGFVSASAMHWNRYLHPKAPLYSPQPADGWGGGETAVLTLPPELQYSSQPLNGKERRREGERYLRREDRAVKHFRACHSRVMKHSKRIYLCNF